MHVGMVLEGDYRDSSTQEDAFEEMFALMETAEVDGLDGGWLAGRHFAAPGRPLDAFGAGIPSIASAPLVLASAIAARTSRLCNGPHLADKHGAGILSWSVPRDTVQRTNRQAMGVSSRCIRNRRVAPL